MTKEKPKKEELKMPDRIEASQAFDEPRPALEQKKRRREIFIAFVLSFLIVVFGWFEVRLWGVSQKLQYSVFFIGLVNFNIVILLLLLFLIFRNVVKVFVERQGKVFGSSLKAKLITSFVSFSSVPTVLMFIISVFYINFSFDKWFSVKMIGILRSSLEVQQEYYFSAKKKNYHFAYEIASQIKMQKSEYKIKETMQHLRKEFALDAVEYYPSLFGGRVSAVRSDEGFTGLTELPPVSLEFLQKGIVDQVEGSSIHQFGDGNLVRVIVPVKDGTRKAAIVVSSFVPLSLISQMNDVSAAYAELQDVNPLEYPLKSIYMIILFLVTFVILLAATWFGFHLARQLAVPLVQLGLATRRVAGGDYTQLEIKSGSEEISTLITSFNQMTRNLESSETSLKETVKYIEVVLAHVSTGVISVDKNGRIQTINRHAGHLLKIDYETFIGRPVRDLLTLEYFRTFSEMLKTMQEHRIESIQKEFKVNIQGESVPLLMNLSLLKDELGVEIGKILVFDDLTPIVSAQRAAAWTEVARRIAHEIKNPLTPIKLSAERLRKKFGDLIKDPAFDECTTMIIRQTDDLKNLVNEFSQFARLPQSRPVEGSLNKVVEESLGLFRQAHNHFKFDLELDADLPEFRFDPDQIRRVLVNLIDNAVAACQKVTEPQIKVHTRYDVDLRIARLSVIDNGDGIPATDRQRVFEPYYSTKESGTGLGLAIVKRIVEDHNGFIRATSNEPRGTKMVIEFPLSQTGAWIPSGAEKAGS
jgi:two-component system nitrogen regulation sensor histidine kinase NtrY